MLVENNKLKVGEVLIFKLVSGEEIIAKISGFGLGHGTNSSETVLLTNACMLIQTQKGPTLAPYLMMGSFDKKLSLYINNIMVYQEPEGSFLQAYNQATGAILVPQAQGIII